MSYKTVGVGRKRQPLSKEKGELVSPSKSSSKPRSSKGSALRSLLQPKEEKAGVTGRGKKSTVQAATCGSKMELRKNRKRKSNHSSSDDATSDEDDDTDDATRNVIVNDQNPQENTGGWTVLSSEKRPSTKQSILALYEEMQPCTPKEASKLLEISPSKLETWVNETKKQRREKKEVETETFETVREANKMTTYIDRFSGTQYIIVEDSGDEGLPVANCSNAQIWTEQPVPGTRNKPNLLSRRANAVQEISPAVAPSQKPNNIVQEISSCPVTFSQQKAPRKKSQILSLREKCELLKKYDAMQPCTRKSAAEALGIPVYTLSLLLNNREHWEKKYASKVLEEVKVLRMYDALESKHDAHISLGVSSEMLTKLLPRRAEVERECRKNFPDVVIIEEFVDGGQGQNLGFELLRWYQAQERDGKTITWNETKEKAIEIAEKLNLPDFVPSDKWLMKWSKSLTVEKKAPSNPPDKTVAVYEGEADTNDDRGASSNFLAALKHFHPNDIFNMDESGLYYRAIPDQPLLKDDWVTVLFACNMSGTEKKELLVAGKSEAPLCFSVLPLPVKYVHNVEACITRETVAIFLKRWDKELASVNRSVALVLEECSSHPKLQLDHIRLYFTGNDSSNLPLRRGIISHTKSSYRRSMAASLLKFDSTRILNEALSKRITIVDALFMLAESWDVVPKSTLITAFSTAFPLGHANPEEDDIEADVCILNELDEDIRVHLGEPSQNSTAPDPESMIAVYGSHDISDDEQTSIVGETVVHIEGTVSMSDEEIEDFDLDNFVYSGSSSAGKGEILEISLSNGHQVESRKKLTIPSTRSLLAPPQRNEESPPSVNEVKNALSTIKRFLQSNGGTLEDLTDYTQLETKVLSKLPLWCVM